MTIALCFIAVALVVLAHAVIKGRRDALSAMAELRQVVIDRTERKPLRPRQSETAPMDGRSFLRERLDLRRAKG